MNLVLTERNALDAPELGIELGTALQRLYPADFKIGAFWELLVRSRRLDGLMAGRDPRRVAQDWQEELQKFEVVSKKYLIY